MKQVIWLVITLFMVSITPFPAYGWDIQPDKAAHALGGGLSTALGLYYEQPIQGRFMTALTMAIAKEGYDASQGHPADIADIEATMVGWALTEVGVWIFNVITQPK
jgi:hypothetical protein